MGYNENTQATAQTGTNSTTTNTAPTIDDLPATLQVNENQTQVTNVSASDENGDTLTYSLTGEDADLLQISTSGALTFKDAPDFETKNSFDVTVAVTDGQNETSQAITISIIDVAETVSQAPVEIVVIVQSVSDGYSSSNKYSVDGEVAPSITLNRGKTYRFLQSDGSNANHPVRFSITSGGTHNNGSSLVDGVSYVATPGTAGAYTQLVISADSNLTTLYYFCSNHQGMGGSITVTDTDSSGYGTSPAEWY